jgi:hypothetical protein
MRSRILGQAARKPFRKIVAIVLVHGANNVFCRRMFQVSWAFILAPVICLAMAHQGRTDRAALPDRACHGGDTALMAVRRHRHLRVDQRLERPALLPFGRDGAGVVSSPSLRPGGLSHRGPLRRHSLCLPRSRLRRYLQLLTAGPGDRRGKRDGRQRVDWDATSMQKTRRYICEATGLRPIPPYLTMQLPCQTC